MWDTSGYTCKKWPCERIKSEIKIGEARVSPGDEDLAEADMEGTIMYREWAEASEADCLDKKNPNLGDSEHPVPVFRSGLFKTPILK